MSEATTEAAEAQPAEPTRTRGESLLETRNRKMRELFEGKQYKISKEVHLPQGQVFKTPFGHKGRHGFVLLEVDSNGSPASPENKFIVGASVLKVAHDEYAAIHGGLPADFGKSQRQIKAEAAEAAKAAETEQASQPETVDA